MWVCSVASIARAGDRGRWEVVDDAAASQAGRACSVALSDRRSGPTTPVVVGVLSEGTIDKRGDRLATEEPLEIRVAAGGGARPVATTMRTPGNDFELAAGFLLSEGLVSSRHDLRRIVYCRDVPDGEQLFNVVTVEFVAPVLPDLAGFERHGTVSSACGVCGRASLDRLRARGVATVAPGGPLVEAQILFGLPDSLRASQRNFEATGGLHAAGLFEADGTLLCAREDVGRHNAVDKVLGWALMHDHLPLAEHILMVSGRAGFDIVEKAVGAGIAVVCAVSAPSSLAVATAEEFGATLIGFLRGRSANVYSGAHRVITSTG